MSRYVRRGAVFASSFKFLAEKEFWLALEWANRCPIGLFSQTDSLSSSMQGGTDNLVRWERFKEGSDSQADLVGQS